jgi:hypothetical protein
MPVYRLEAGSYTSKMFKWLVSDQILKKYILQFVSFLYFWKQMMKIYKLEKDKMTEKWTKLGILFC